MDQNKAFFCSALRIHLFFTESYADIAPIADILYLALHLSPNCLVTSGTPLRISLVMVMSGIFLKGHALNSTKYYNLFHVKHYCRSWSVAKLRFSFHLAFWNQYFSLSLDKLFSHVCLHIVSHSSWRKTTFLHYSNNFYFLSAVPPPFFFWRREVGGIGFWFVCVWDCFVLFCFVVTGIQSKEAHYISVP